MAQKVEIMKALRGRLIAFAATKDLEVAFTNRDFTPPASGRYLRETFISNSSSRRWLKSGGPNAHEGLYQIDFFLPKAAGETAALIMAGEIAAFFPEQLRLESGGVRVRITKQPDTPGLLIEDSTAMIPVTVSWQTYG